MAQTTTVRREKKLSALQMGMQLQPFLYLPGRFHLLLGSECIAFVAGLQMDAHEDDPLSAVRPMGVVATEISQ